MSKKLGAVPYQTIIGMIADGSIKGALESSVRPASLDLRLSDEFYRVDGIFLPRPGEKVRNILPEMGAVEHSLDYPLERGVTYLARLEESLELKEDIYGYSNPKSSTGRNDIHARVIADGVSRYDTTAPAGFSGELWLAIEPRSYPVRLKPGVSLSQIRFFNHDTRFNEEELMFYFERDQLLWHKGRPLSYNEINIKDDDGALILTAELEDALVGYECRGSGKVLDFSLKGHYQPEEFFQPLKSSKGTVLLKKDSFYIIRTKEAVRVPPHFSSEVVPMDERSGEFRTHYAGFFDPGWGWGENGEGKGRRGVLEIRPFSDVLLRDGQPVAKFRFEKMMEAPEANYDAMPDSNYNSKEEENLPRLSKHFKVPV
ncbi:2'-deoxycytidine 5'-triphosphate deaminase [Candidatus Giovannonibacteria bacterium]|nr:2'-deoxycytidine 5'-triphosphate deaminase [Candidatus Giovannonibacteria bacterium]